MDILIFLLVLSILIIVHEFGHFIAARSVGVRVEQFSLGFGPRLLKKKKGDTEYSFSLLPLGGYVKLAGDNLQEYGGKSDEFYSKKISQRLRIIFCGPLLNYILGILCFWLILFMGYPALSTKVAGLLDGYGAKEAGILVGDQILAIDRVKTNSWEQMQRVIQSQKNKSRLEVTLLRQGEELVFEVELKQKSLEDELRQKKNVGLLGITSGDEVIILRHGFFESLPLAIKKTWELTELTYRGLWLMITGKISVRESVSGPLQIFFMTAKVARLGLLALIHFIALLSISLAIFNLLPIPIFDGGHIFLLALEKIRNRKISLKTEQRINQVGLAIIIVLIVLVTFNDILKNYGDKFKAFIK